MPPILLLVGVFLITALAMALDLRRRRRTHLALRALASRRGMHFSIRDQLRLTPRVAQFIPVPGAAGIRVHNLLYVSDGGERRYLFTVEYTTGVVQWKKRISQVGMFSEPRERSSAEGPCIIRLASRELPLLRQYESLLEKRP